MLVSQDNPALFAQSIVGGIPQRRQPGMTEYLALAVYHRPHDRESDQKARRGKSAQAREDRQLRRCDELAGGIGTAERRLIHGGQRIAIIVRDGVQRQALGGDQIEDHTVDGHARPASREHQAGGRQQAEDRPDMQKVEDQARQRPAALQHPPGQPHIDERKRDKEGEQRQPDCVAREHDHHGLPRRIQHRRAAQIFDDRGLAEGCRIHVVNENERREPHQPGDRDDERKGQKRQSPQRRRPFRSRRLLHCGPQRRRIDLEGILQQPAVVGELDRPVIRGLRRRLDLPLRLVWDMVSGAPTRIVKRPGCEPFRHLR